MKTFKIIGLLIMLFYASYANSQNYKAAFRADMCECLEQESLKRKLTDNAYKSCFREILPKYATQIDAQIIEEDLNKKYLLGQLARRDLIVAMQTELVYTCTIYFDHLESEKLSKKLIAREQVKESDLEAQNQFVAMSPSALAYYSRAQLHYNLGNLAEAEADIRKSLDVNPNSDNVKSTRNELLLLALIYEEKKQYTQAIALYDEVYFGVYDYPVAILRAIADKNAGGNVNNIPNLNEEKVQKTNSNTRSRRQPATSRTTRSKIKKGKKEAEKKTDTSSLKKLFKIDN